VERGKGLVALGDGPERYCPPQVVQELQDMQRCMRASLWGGATCCVMSLPPPSTVMNCAA